MAFRVDLYLLTRSEPLFHPAYRQAGKLQGHMPSIEKREKEKG